MQTHFRSSGEKKVDKQTRSLFLCPRGVTGSLYRHRTRLLSLYSHTISLSEISGTIVLATELINLMFIPNRIFLKMYNPYNLQLCKYVQSDDEIRLKSLL